MFDCLFLIDLTGASREISPGYQEEPSGSVKCENPGYAGNFANRSGFMGVRFPPSGLSSKT